MNEDRDVVDFVRSGRAGLPPDVAARVARQLRGQAGLPHSGMRGRLFAAAVIAAGVLVASGVAWLRRDSAPQPAHAPEPPVLQDGGPQEPAKDGQPLDLEETKKSASLIAVIDVFFPSGVLAEDGLFGTVTRVLHGDGALVGQRVWLHWNAAAPPSRPGCFDQFDLAADRAAPGKHWLMALAPMTADEAKAAGPTRTAAWVDQAAKLPWFRSPFSRGLAGTPVTKNGGEASIAGELLAAIRQPAGGSRRLALSALSDLSGIAEPDAKSPLRDPAIIQELARLSLDGDADLRAELAASLPRLDGDAEVAAALQRLLFDPVAAVRMGILRRSFTQPWRKDPNDDSWWTAMTWPGAFRSYAISAETKARQEGVTTDLGVWERQLKKDRAENHLLGALGLAEMRDAAALARLVELAQHVDGRVRAAAAGGRIVQGDRGGYEQLRALLQNGDAAAAVCALDVVRRQSSPESFDLLRLAASHGQPWVRALAVAGIREQRKHAPHEAEQLLSRLGGDEAEIVRIAAGTAPLQVEQPWCGGSTAPGK